MKQHYNDDAQLLDRIKSFNNLKFNYSYSSQVSNKHAGSIHQEGLKNTGRINAQI